MVVLCDTNVLINYITGRDDKYSAECFSLIDRCRDGTLKGYMAVHSVSILWYVLIKIKETGEVREWLRNLCEVVHVAGVDTQQVIDAVNREDFADFEDCLQDECAVSADADYIVTRNIKDFERSKVKAVTPDKMLRILEENRNTKSAHECEPAWKTNKGISN